MTAAARQEMQGGTQPDAGAASRLRVDVRDLRSVRQAARALGWSGAQGPGQGVERETGAAGSDSSDEKAVPGLSLSVGLAGAGRRLQTLLRSPIARRIVALNLLALLLLAAGMIWLSPSRGSLLTQRMSSLARGAEIVATVVAARLPDGDPGGDLVGGSGVLQDMPGGLDVDLYDLSGTLVGSARPESDAVPDAAKAGLVARALAEGPVTATLADAQGRAIPAAAALVRRDGRAVGVLLVHGHAEEIEAFVRIERRQVLWLSAAGLLASVALSLALAATIATPLADLAAAVETGQQGNARALPAGRVRIPDLSARPDEIGRLSAALCGTVAALYDRVEANEQFAADVAHEIRNPLASLRSAVGAFGVAKREDQRERLLAIIGHDVRRLDRLVSDISKASRLDSDLVKEEERPFDLIQLLAALGDRLGQEAREQGVDLVVDLPDRPIVLRGLESRLAQVFENVVGNALSFSEEGDAIRIWARQRENRVLAVVEDTGPGIPEEALTKIFQRFYSERPDGHFGNNSGLGLAISRQIVEAHGGVIWAENVRPTEADPSSEPLGARFVVGLPV